MPRKQPTLHEAMVMILEKCPDRTATHHVLYQENRRRDLYRRSDGKHPKADEILSRAAKYPYLFERLGLGELRLWGATARRDAGRRW